MGARSLRRLDQPRPVDVIAGPSGIPYAIVADGRRRQVTAIRDDWLVQDRWWTETPVDRHYFELVLEPGRVIIAFRDLRAGSWHAHVPGKDPPSNRRAAKAV